MRTEETKCPEYYLLAEGLQFAEYTRTRIVPLLEGGNFSSFVIHCVSSALEHRFRRGRKEGEYLTDVESEAWWMAKARESACTSLDKFNDFEFLVGVCRDLIDYEKLRKDVRSI